MRRNLLQTRTSMGNEENQQKPPVRNRPDKSGIEFEVKNLKKGNAKLKYKVKSIERNVKKNTKTLNFLLSTMHVISQMTNETTSSVEQVLKKLNECDTAVETVETGTPKDPVNLPNIVLQTSELLEHYGVEFNDDNVLFPHRFVRKFQEITDPANLTSEYRAILFREAIKSRSGQVWKMRNRIASFEELKIKFLKDFWTQDRQFKAIYYIQHEEVPVDSIQELLIKLLEHNETLEMTDVCSKKVILEYLHEKIPKRLKKKLSYNALQYSKSLFSELESLAVSEYEY